MSIFFYFYFFWSDTFPPRLQQDNNSTLYKVHITLISGQLRGCGR